MNSMSTTGVTGERRWSRYDSVSSTSTPPGTGANATLWRPLIDGSTTEVSDPSISGRQSVAFAPVPGGVEVELTLSYRLQRRSPVTPVVDMLFIRRAIASSLETTLARFAHERDSERGS